MTHRLKEGLRAFHTTEFPRRRDHFETLAKGQSPRTLFITCSDSRIDPSLITQTDPGELFVIRNAGNLVPRHGETPIGGDAATLEYAVLALGVKDIVVCGHSHCGAMGGLMAPETLEALPGVASWLRHAEPTRTRVEAAAPDSDERDAVRTNVRVQLEQLLSYPYVAERVARGDLTLHGWVYVLEEGQVLELGADGAFAPLLPSSAASA